MNSNRFRRLIGFTVAALCWLSLVGCGTSSDKTKKSEDLNADVAANIPTPIKPVLWIAFIGKPEESPKAYLKDISFLDNLIVGKTIRVIAGMGMYYDEWEDRYKGRYLRLIGTVKKDGTEQEYLFDCRVPDDPTLFYGLSGKREIEVQGVITEIGSRKDMPTVRLSQCQIIRPRGYVPLSEYQLDTIRSLQGKWVVIRCEGKGEYPPQLYGLEEIVIDGESMEWIHNLPDKNYNNVFSSPRFGFEVVSSKSSREMDLHSIFGYTIPALYKVDGYMLRICVRWPVTKVRSQNLPPRPTSFEAGKDNQVVITANKKL